jgi:hypothetical protein
LGYQYYCKTTKKSIVPHDTFHIPHPFRIVRLSISIIFLFSLASCTSAEKKAKATPSIAFTGISADSVVAGSNQVINLKFNFSDGDGDLGNTPSSGNFDIYTTDTRDTTAINYYFPPNMKTYIDPTQGVSGECVIQLNAAFMLLRPDRPKRDTLQYEVYIKDKSGKESNRFTTPNIYLTL